MVNIVKLAEEFGQGKKEIQQLYNDFDELMKSLQNAYPIIENFRETVRSFPRATSKLNKAKRITVNTLEKLAEEYLIAINLTGEGLSYLKNWMNNMKN